MKKSDTKESNTPQWGKLLIPNSLYNASKQASIMTGSI